MNHFTFLFFLVHNMFLNARDFFFTLVFSKSVGHSKERFYRFNILFFALFESTLSIFYNQFPVNFYNICKNYHSNLFSSKKESIRNY